MAEPVAVANMPTLFQHFNTILDQPAAFYVSQAPAQFYPRLRAFITNANFIPGEISLSLSTIAGFLNAMYNPLAVQRYKVSVVSSYYLRFPHRKMILIGDSGQRDPEAYGDIFRAYSHMNWVSCIYIREITGQNARKEKRLNSAARFELAFAGVPRNRWVLFQDPLQLQSITAEMIESGQCGLPQDSSD